MLGRTTAFALALFGVLTSEASATGRLLLDEDFSQPGLFAERWEPLGGNRREVVVRDGRLRVPWSKVRLRQQLPAEYVAEVTLANFPSWSTPPENLKGPRRAGISSDYGEFGIGATGGTAMIWRLPSWRSSHGSYKGFPNYVMGKDVRIRLERRKVGAQFRYLFFVEGELMGDYLAPDPSVTNDPKGVPYAKPFVLYGFNEAAEFDDIRIYDVSQADGSPNMLQNSSFEYDEDGVPTHVQFPFPFDWNRRPSEEYETKYLKTCRADREVFHSGRQSLRVNVTDASERINIRPFGAAVEQDLSGVFSVWLRASRDGLPVTLNLAGSRTTVKVAKEWRRYEVINERLPKPGCQSATEIFLATRGWEGTTLWIDDCQAEIVNRPEEGFVAGRTYASAWRPSSTDALRFARKPPAKRPAVDPAASVRTAAQSALRGYPLKPGETLVLPEYNYYMDEPTANFRVWDEQGRLAETSVDLSNLPYGTNSVTVKAHGRDWPAKIVRRPKRAGASQVDHFARAVIHDGQPVFFSGLCSTTKPLMLNSADGTYPQVDFLASRGFRHFHIAVWDDEKLIDAAARIFERGAAKGMLFDLWSELQHGSKTKMGLDEAWRRLSPPNVCINQILDEPDLRYSPEQIAAFMRDAHVRLPYGCVMFNGTGNSVMKANIDTDVFMIDNYLTNNSDGRTVESVVSSVDHLAKVRPGTPVWYFLVNDNMTLHYKNPSYGEQVAQSWGSVCAGATGLSWYIGFPSTEPTWRANVDVNREVQQLAPALLSKELCGEAGASETTQYLRVLTRRHQGAVYVFACNIDAQALGEVRFALPPEAPQDGTVEVVYENRRLPLANGGFADGFAGHTRHIYRIQNGKGKTE